MDSEEIRFRQRIVDTENLGEVVDGLMSMFKRETTLFLQTSGCVDSNRQVFAIVFSIRMCLDVFKISNSPCSKLVDLISMARWVRQTDHGYSHRCSLLVSSQRIPSSDRLCSLG
jgi:hypothetical protein